MADDLRMALETLLRKAELNDPDFLREGIQLIAQEPDGAGGQSAPGSGAL